MQDESRSGRGRALCTRLSDACSGLQSFAWPANLCAVQRSASAVLLLASFGGLGCATGGLAVPGRAVTPSALVPSEAPAASFTVAAREASSPRAEGAAYLTLRVGTARDAEAEDRTAAILSTSARCPAEMALVDGHVCVDRWEASLVERVSSGVSGSAERAWSPFLAIDGHEHQVRAISRPGVLPQAYISGKQASAACTASGKRLCAADEWERACRGPSNFQFPYGDQRRAGACNDDVRSVHPVAEVGRILGIARGRLWHEGMNQPLINQLANTLLPTGERAECTNEYGVYDMVGNLHEWVDDPDGTFRGGYYMDTTKNGDGCSYQTTAHAFTYHDYSTGFRCCMDPEQVE
jgi:formylglycine-generating enzyme